MESHFISIFFVVFIFTVNRLEIVSGNSCSGIYKNINFPLRGYNIRKGNPFANHGDPGFTSQIFIATKTDSHGKIVLQNGITAAGLSTCQRYMTAKSFSSLQSYRSFMTESSKVGVDLQIGTETKVTAGIKIKIIDLKVEKKIPPAFKRAWSESRGMKKLEEFFSEKKGMVALTLGVCTMYEVKLSPYHLPPFRSAFKAALTELYKAANLTPNQRISVFRKFIRHYGTHFQLATKLGAQFMHQTRYTETARKSLSAESLRACNNLKGAEVFGIQVEKDKSSCTTSDKQKLKQLGHKNVEELIITKGSRPTDIKKWAVQDYVPIPLAFELSPIVNLFTDKLIRDANIRINGKRITDSFTIRKWFVPLYFDFCKTVGIEAHCLPKKGCGFDDLCPVDSICKPGGSIHRCTQWSQWACFNACGVSHTQRRHRSCTGCTGARTQHRRGNCPSKPPCYRPFTTIVRKTPFNLDGGHKNTIYLDRHNMHCPVNTALSGFILQRNDLANKIRYLYFCSATQLPCNLYFKRTEPKNNGHGNLIYLDRNHVACNNNDLLVRAHYRTNGQGESWYDTVCCRMKYKQSCVVRHSPATIHDHDGSVIYLDRQVVRCPAYHTLSSFFLRRTSKNFIRYRYKCCRTLPLTG